MVTSDAQVGCDFSSTGARESLGSVRAGALVAIVGATTRAFRPVFFRDYGAPTDMIGKFEFVLAKMEVL
jgi:hypothetical protein